MHLLFSDLSEKKQKSYIKDLCTKKKAKGNNDPDWEIREGIKQGEDVIIGTINDDREDWLVVWS